MNYDYLNQIPELPLMVQNGLGYLGLKETPGTVSNKTITDWAKEIGGKVADIYKSDDIPWCGLFMAVMAVRSNKMPPIDPLWALNWNTFGNRVEIKQAALGDVLVFVRKQGGHVGLYCGEDDTAYHVLGGNQSDSVSITRVAKSRIYGVRRPAYNIQPTSVKKHILTATGKLSTNES